jgi:hypothetical protein
MPVIHVRAVVMFEDTLTGVTLIAPDAAYVASDIIRAPTNTVGTADPYFKMKR